MDNASEEETGGPPYSSIDECTPTSPSTKTHRALLYKLAHLSYPLILCELFQSLLPVVDIAFVGNLGKDELAIAALATTWFNFVNVVSQQVLFIRYYLECS
jgi:Na+-driven multidrug efflux pump